MSKDIAPGFLEHSESKEVRKWLSGRHDELVSMVRNWAEINSGTENLDGVERMAQALEAAFCDLGLPSARIKLPPFQSVSKMGEVELKQVGDILQWRCRPAAPIQVFLNGHRDTVFAHDHPFQKCRLVSPGVLNGPGVTDMKGGLVVMLAALQAFERSSVRENVGWEVMISADEEIGSPASSSILKEAAVRHHLGIVFESALPDGALIRSRMGTGNFTAIARGKASHVGRDFSGGRNAIVLLAEFAARFHELNSEIPEGIFNVGFLQGGDALNVVPDNATAQFNIRVPGAGVQKRIEKKLVSMVEEFNRRDGFRLEWKGSISRAAKIATPAVCRLFEAWKDCATVQGLQLGWRDTGGGSDGNILLAEGLTNIDNLGVRGGNIHNHDEYILLDSLVERAQLTASFLINLAAGNFDRNGISFIEEIC